jgi:nucleoid DNA-binding protein
MGEFASELFQRVLKVLSKGERVMIARFGSFQARYVQGHKINHFGVEKKATGRNIIRFRAAAAAKEVVNSRFAKEHKKNERRVGGAGVAPKTRKEDVPREQPEQSSEGGDQAARGSEGAVVSSARRRARGARAGK